MTQKFNLDKWKDKLDKIIAELPENYIYLTYVGEPSDGRKTETVELITGRCSFYTTATIMVAFMLSHELEGTPFNEQLKFIKKLYKVHKKENQ